MKRKQCISIRFVREDSRRLRLFRSGKPTLRDRLLRLLLGPCLHVVVVTPGKATATVSIHAQSNS